MATVNKSSIQGYKYFLSALLKWEAVDREHRQDKALRFHDKWMLKKNNKNIPCYSKMQNPKIRKNETF